MSFYFLVYVFKRVVLIHFERCLYRANVFKYAWAGAIEIIYFIIIIIIIFIIIIIHLNWESI